SERLVPQQQSRRCRPPRPLTSDWRVSQRSSFFDELIVDSICAGQNHKERHRESRNPLHRDKKKGARRLPFQVRWIGYSPYTINVADGMIRWARREVCWLPPAMWAIYCFPPTE